MNAQSQNGIATLTLQRGKVNPINDTLVNDIRVSLDAMVDDAEIKAVILTGQDKFFSFGFDVPELLTLSREDFTAFLVRFTEFYRYMFLYPKPIVAALNGHTIAGGCMMALACDYRLMVSEKAKISLNEIDLGVPVFAGITEILRFVAGNKNATTILYSGNMFTADEAKELDLIDGMADGSELLGAANELAQDLGNKPPAAFAGLKKLLRRPIISNIKEKELQSIKAFVEIWYSAEAQEILHTIKIF